MLRHQRRDRRRRDALLLLCSFTVFWALVPRMLLAQALQRGAGNQALVGQFLWAVVLFTLVVVLLARFVFFLGQRYFGVLAPEQRDVSYYRLFAK